VPTLSPAPSSALDLGLALRDGWTAFRRAPWTLSGFMLLVSALAIGLLLLERALTSASGALPSLAPPALLLCRLACLLLVLWGTVGLVRGAWIALEGERPRFGALLRWDGAALARVALASLLLGLLLTLLSLPLTWLLAIGVEQLLEFDFPLHGPPLLRAVNPSPGALLLVGGSALALLGLMTYAQVSQHFLVQLAALQGSGPWRTLHRGQTAVDRRCWTVLALLGVESLLLLAGILAMVVGLFVAVPLVACVSTAAYRQLFGAAHAAAAALPGPAA
jgi:hypothetical protein